MSKHTPAPLYEQLKEALCARIRNGEFKPGDRIPSETELADEAGVSRITSKRALEELAQDGWVYRIRGKGTFVSEHLPPPQMNASKAVGIIVRHLRDSYATGIVLG